MPDIRLFKQFPTLKFIIPHGGGAVPYHWGRFRGLAQDMKLPPLTEHLLNNVFFDTCVYHMPGQELLAKVIPVRNILFASEMIGAVRGHRSGNRAPFRRHQTLHRTTDAAARGQGQDLRGQRETGLRPAVGTTCQTVRRGAGVNQPTDPDAAARDALRLIGPDPQGWVPDRSGIDHNVTIVGGGQTGSAVSFALRRAGIGKMTVIDAAEDEARAGVWLNAARMNLLRTPKSLPGPELGIPAFGFQSWYEARHGAEAYAAIDRIPRTDWAAYLTWYRRFLGIAIRYRTRLLRIEPGEWAVSDCTWRWMVGPG